MIPLLARVYPNGYADVNQFHEAGGMAFLIEQLLDAGLLHADVRTVFGTGLDGYAQVPQLDADRQAARGSRSPRRAAIAACCVASTIRSAPMAACAC